jgi:hypothetical protein
MVLKFVVPIVMGMALVGAAPAMAADYRPDDFLKLDLSKAVLSPAPLGPEAHFEPLPVEANADTKADPSADQTSGGAVAATQPRARPDVPRKLATPRVHVARPLERSRGAARTKLAHRRGNPLDAQAMDTRIQTWPCRPGGGGICNWR